MTGEWPDTAENPDSLADKLRATLNAYSAENTSNTPDWILADYLLGCLDAFDLAVLAREKFYGIKSEPGGGRYAEPTL